MKKKLIISFLLLLTLSLLFVLLQSTGKKTVIQRLAIEKTSAADGTLSPNSSLEDKSLDEQTTNKQQQDYILECSGDFFDNLSEGDLEKYSDSAYFNEAFRNSSNFHSRLAYALIVSNKELLASGGGKFHTDQVSLFKNLLNHGEELPLVHYFLVSKCSEETNFGKCDDSVVAEAIKNDPNNAALWFQIAVIEASKDDLMGVSFALEQIIAAPNFNEYWTESIDVFNNALLANGVKHKGARLVMSIGYASALSLGPIGDLFELCKVQSSSRADIAQLCIDAGKKMAVHAKTSMIRSFGYTLQEQVYKATNDKTNETKTRELRKLNYQTSSGSAKVGNLMLFDEELSQYWFTQLKLFGEKKAMQLTYQEAVRLSSNPDYNPCPENHNLE